VDYFDGLMVNRSRLVWSIATRRQLERWEPLVAANVHLGWRNQQLDSERIWLAETEHHFVLIAARNLLRALELPPASVVPLEPTMRKEIIEGRDLHEHWVENLPVFNTTPRPTENLRHRSPKDFDARNPMRGPYDWLAWDNKQGALLLPHVSAAELHELVDEAESEVLALDSTLQRFVPLRPPSPWIRDNDEWWPSADVVAEFLRPSTVGSQ
jgi:hypothetical protein